MAEKREDSKADEAWAQFEADRVASEKQMADGADFAVKKQPEIKPQHRSDWKNKQGFMRDMLAKQPKVSVRIAKSFGPQTVILNGHRFNIPAGIPVDVPEQVAQVLREAELA